MTDDPRIAALPDSHGHAKGEHKPFAEERPIPYTARMLFLWFFHACRRGSPRFMMVADHINYLTFEDPAAVNLVRRALKLAQAGDLYGAAETAGVDVAHAAVVSEGLRRGMRYSIGAEVDNDPRSRPDAQNIVDAMRPDGMVRSVHFLPIVHPQHGEWMWPFDNPEYLDVYDVVGVEQTWELYMTTLLEAIDKLPGHIVGHFYVPGKFGHWPDEATLEGYEDRFLDACAERGMAVEVNARFFYKGGSAADEAAIDRYRELHVRLLRKAKAKNVMVAVGSDAHSPKDQGRGFAEVLAILDLAEINEIAFPISGRLARVALRATEETMRAVAAEAASARAASLAAIPTDDDDHEDEPAAAATPVTASPAADAPAKAPARKRPSRAKPKVAAPEAVADVDGVAQADGSGSISSVEPQAVAAPPIEEAPPAAFPEPTAVPEPVVAAPEPTPAAADAAIDEAPAAASPPVAAPPARARPKRAVAPKRPPKASAKRTARPAAKSTASARSKAPAAKAKAAAKPASRKPAAKTAAAKPAAKKAKRPVAKRAPVAKKAAAKKSTARAVAKRAPVAKRSAAKKTAAKKTTAKKKSGKPRR